MFKLEFLNIIAIAKRQLEVTGNSKIPGLKFEINLMILICKHRFSITLITLQSVFFFKDK